MKLPPRMNRPEFRAVLRRLSRYGKPEVRRSLWACLICLSLSVGFVSPAVSAKVKKRPAKPKVVKPTVTNIKFRKLAAATASAKNMIPVSVDIIGTGFGKALADDAVKVTLTNPDTGESVEAEVSRATDTKIFARAEVPALEGGPTRSDVELEINGESVDTDKYLFEIPNVKPPQPKPRSVEVDIKEINNPQNPTLHSVLITPKDDSETFAADPTDPKAMKVQILPPGATNVTIEPVSTPEKTLITFVAPEGFKVQDLLVTVFDSRAQDLTAAPRKRAASMPVGKEVKISKVDVLSLQRRDGFGRLKIEGEGFGNYKSPPVSSDLEIICDPANRASHVDEREDTNRRSATDSTVPDTSSLCWNGGTRRDFKGLNQDWRKEVAASINVQLVPRNPDLRVERTLIMYADDKVIDVYFEFSHWTDYSEPFRLQSVSVSVTKEDPASEPIKSAHATAAAARTTSKTYIDSFPIGPQKDPKLEYRYTVFDQEDASELFGSGVGANFYVLQLSVVNNGDKKLVVPLSSIQAEIEWSYREETKGTVTTFHDEGPVTLSPIKLSAISSYFDTFQKTKGRKARVFNILEGVVTLGASLVPVFGKGLERGNSIMSGGLIPGLRQAWGDLSSQQLQNLTSMSWDSLEEIPAGGAKEKFIYIQRSDQSFSNKSDKNFKINKTIKSIQGLEVSGFVVNDSTATSAVKQQ